MLMAKGGKQASSEKKSVLPVTGHSFHRVKAAPPWPWLLFEWRKFRAQNQSFEVESGFAANIELE